MARGPFVPPRRAPLRGRSRERIPWRDLLTPEPDGQGPVLNGAPAADVLPQGTAASAGRGAESLRWLGTGVLFRCVGDRFRVRLMSSRDRKVRHSHKRQRGRFPGLEQFLGAQPAVVHTAPARVEEPPPPPEATVGPELGCLLSRLRKRPGNDLICLGRAERCRPLSAHHFNPF